VRGVSRWWMVAWLAAGGGGPSEPLEETGRPDTDTDPPVEPPTGELPDPATVRLAGPCPMVRHHGGFTVTADETTTVVSGSVSDGVLPLSVLEEVGAEGDCVLLRRNLPHCDPPCEPSETCDFDGTCIPYPVQQDMGTVFVRGLVQPVQMEPWKPGFSYYELGLPHPAFEPDEPIVLNATGGVHGPFELYGVGVGPLEVLDEVWVLADGVDAKLHWTPLGGLGRSRIHVAIHIDLHGVTPVQLECSFADTGEGTVPGSLISQFIGFGVTGYPQASVRRHTVDSVDLGDGCVALEVAWRGKASVDVAGFHPCSHFEPDCPDGLTCNFDLEICE